MIDRTCLEQREREWLAPYAVLSETSRGRKYPEKEHDFRTAFGRDRDRIVYSTAFRRLEYKTQVFVNHEGDHYRTRLTHTLEMSLIARTIGRALRLNEDLIEAVALAHDLGHGPFGHAGQDALSVLMRGHGSFEHNRQCLRIVEELEESYSGFPGLNLTVEVRDGLRKHERQRVRSLEADVVDLADSIAYHCHDLDDGLRAELLDTRDALRTGLWKEANRYIERKVRSASRVVKVKMGIRLLMNRLVGDVIGETMKNIRRFKIAAPEDYARTRTPVVQFSKALRPKVNELKQFLTEHLYQHYRVIRMTEKGQRVIKGLFQVYLSQPKQLPPSVLKRISQDGLERVICDYVAGMTDRFALDEYERLFAPYERV
ncbi:MAG: deoxyguanosinetriphosphate triphosphohydrolase [Omnitrophica bacterium RIFCSPLOWO2_01_FULL_50_24]|nr:MAG: deoxyguanosinetriphosphate triphosphohydrolase [Omnitrophica bacterium RIFCSPLOWO2_01_FULL_50_24]